MAPRSHARDLRVVPSVSKRVLLMRVLWVEGCVTKRRFQGHMMISATPVLWFPSRILLPLAVLVGAGVRGGSNLTVAKSDDADHLSARWKSHSLLCLLSFMND